MIAMAFFACGIITLFYYLTWTNKEILAIYIGGFLTAFSILVMWGVILDMKVTRDLPPRKTNI